MEDAFNKTLTSLLFAPGAQNWYGYELNIPVIPFPKKEKTNFPLYPNKKLLLPSGEIANLTPPDEVPIQVKGTDEDVEDEYQISDDDDEMECEDTVVHNSVQPVIRLDSCGREVEDFREIMQPSSDEDETVEQQFAFEERSSAPFQPPYQEDEDSSDEETVQASSSVTNKSPKVTAMINQQNGQLKNVSNTTSKQPTPNGGMIRRQYRQLKNASHNTSKQAASDSGTSKQSTPNGGMIRCQYGQLKDASPNTSKQSTSDSGMIHRQYWPVNDSDNGTEPEACSEGIIPTKFVTTDIKIDHFNGMMKYTFIKKPIVEQLEVSSDDDESTHQNGLK